MTSFDAPGLSWSSPTRPVWRAAARFKRAGYQVKTRKLPGTQGDGRDDERAALCRQYQAEAEAFVSGPPAPKPGTWGHLIARYKADEFSPIHDVKANTRESYLGLLDRWDAVLGSVSIASTGYESIRRLDRAMKERGRSASYIKRMSTMLRAVASYGRQTRDNEAARVSDLLSHMRFASSPARNETMTLVQAAAFAEEADARGLPGIGMGVLLCAWFALRPVDVFGQWVPGDGGISRGGRRWQDGLTWDMVAPDFSCFTKVISKTAKSLPDPVRFDLAPLPELRARLRLLGNGPRFGPVIVSDSGAPYTKRTRAQAFRRIARAVGIPDEVRLMDARAGALTDAARLGADPYMVRDFGSHTQLSTTDKYLRDRSENLNNVVKMRKGGA